MEGLSEGNKLSKIITSSPVKFSALVKSVLKTWIQGRTLEDHTRVSFAFNF